jgi:hypothetical protein
MRRSFFGTFASALPSRRTAPAPSVLIAVAAGDMTAEYETAATTARGFCYAPAGGNGQEAVVSIAPERRKGPFSPDEIA